MAAAAATDSSPGAGQRSGMGDCSTSASGCITPSTPDLLHALWVSIKPHLRPSCGGRVACSPMVARQHPAPRPAAASMASDHAPRLPSYHATPRTMQRWPPPPASLPPGGPGPLPRARAAPAARCVRRARRRVRPAGRRDAGLCHDVAARDRARPRGAAGAAWLCGCATRSDRPAARRGTRQSSSGAAFGAANAGLDHPQRGAPCI